MSGNGGDFESLDDWINSVEERSKDKAITDYNQFSIDFKVDNEVTKVIHIDETNILDVKHFLGIDERNLNNMINLRINWINELVLDLHHRNIDHIETIKAHKIKSKHMENVMKFNLIEEESLTNLLKSEHTTSLKVVKKTLEINDSFKNHGKILSLIINKFHIDVQSGCNFILHTSGFLNNYFIINCIDEMIIIKLICWFPITFKTIDLSHIIHKQMERYNSELTFLIGLSSTN